jgi:hypothetical protein
MTTLQLAQKIQRIGYRAFAKECSKTGAYYSKTRPWNKVSKEQQAGFLAIAEHIQKRSYARS